MFPLKRNIPENILFSAVYLRLFFFEKKRIRNGSYLGFPHGMCSTTQTVGVLNFRVRKGNGCATPLWPPDN